MPVYHIITEVESTSGHQEWELTADSPEQALERFNNGEGDICFEEVEVTSISKPDITDVFEVDEPELGSKEPIVHPVPTIDEYFEWCAKNERFVVPEIYKFFTGKDIEV